jgi:hypothetical protein
MRSAQSGLDLENASVCANVLSTTARSSNVVRDYFYPD